MSYQTAESYLEAKGWTKDNPVIGGALFTDFTAMMNDFASHRSEPCRQELERLRQAWSVITNSAYHNSCNAILEQAGSIASKLRAYHDIVFLCFNPPDLDGISLFDKVIRIVENQGNGWTSAKEGDCQDRIAEIAHGNQVISFFMGEDDVVEYHEDIAALMGVVELIEVVRKDCGLGKKNYAVFIQGATAKISLSGKTLFSFNSEVSKTDAVFRVVVQFIDWFTTA